MDSVHHQMIAFDLVGLLTSHSASRLGRSLTVQAFEVVEVFDLTEYVTVQEMQTLSVQDQNRPLQ